MFRIKRFFQRKREIKLNIDRKKQIEESLSSHCNEKILLLPASHKGGNDQIYHAYSNGTVLFVVRVNNEHKISHEIDSKIIKTIKPEERINFEWNVYNVLSQATLSPRAIWKNDFAVACEWFQWKRLSDRLKYDKSNFWSIVELVFGAISKMHKLGVVHLDLNLGNLLISETGDDVRIIDFEYIATEVLSSKQQRVYDFLTIINDFSRNRRGGKLLKKDKEKIAILLDKYLEKDESTVCCGALLPYLKWITKDADFLEYLTNIFPNLQKY